MNSNSYQSPFSWRYGSDEMREIWSDQNIRRIWRQIWAVLAEVQTEFGLVTSEQAEALGENVNQIDLKRSLEVEARLKHDLAAELEVFGEQCPSAKGILHLSIMRTRLNSWPISPTIF